nr:unnamed protein product [Callosobruchus chinensis]
MKVPCHIREQKTDFYQQEKDELADFKVDQTILISEKYLKYIVDAQKIDEECQPDDNALDEWYAYANSYYPYTEDVDPVERVNHLLANPPSFTSLSSLDSRSLVQDKTYSTRSAQISYLESNPVSFIILGKPGIGEQELGKYLADYWKCVYIEPQLLIEHEIGSGSRAGQCIEFNLRCGRAIGIDVILRLVEKRVHSESAKHRGFVICGLPLIPNDLYAEDPVSSESAVFNVREIFDEVLETVVELGVPPPSKPHVSIASKYESVEGEGAEKMEAGEGEEAAPGEGGMQGEGSQTFPDVLPMTKQEPSIPIDIGADYDICQPPEIGTNYEDQLTFLFNLIKDPFLIIYITCSTTDVLEKRDHYRFDLYTQENVSLFREKYDSMIYKYFSKEKGLSADEIPEELFDTPFPDEHSLHKHLVKLPRNFKANVSTQLDSFHYTGLRFIEQRVLAHDPQYFVKVDGRTSVQRMFNIVKTKIKTLPLQNVVLAEKLAVAESQVELGEGGLPLPPQNMRLEDAYREFCRRQTPSTILKWTWSDWGTKCPVSMRDGLYRDGTQEYAVHFMNHIFFLADQDAYIRFFRNPRPYLLPPFPKPTCKFFIFGPKCAGKTAIANCLAFNFSGTVLSIDDMLRNLVSQKIEAIREKIRQAAIAEAMTLLDEMRVVEATEQEKQRVDNIKEWVNMVSSDLEQLAVLLEERDKELETKQFEISSFPMAMRKTAMAEIETEVTIAIRHLRDKFEEYDIPVPDSPDGMRKMAQEKKKLLQYIPDNLKHKVKPKPASVYDDFVIEYAEKAVANANIDIGMANENVLDMFIEGIRKVEENSLEMGNCKGGWILDGMVCDPELIESLYPDYAADEIIVLLDEEGDEFLIDRYKERGSNHFSNYRQFFMELGRVDAAWRAPAEVLPKPFPEAMVRDILSEIFDDSSRFRGMADKDVAYRRELEYFREKWEMVKAFFLNKGVEPIEIKVTGKSLPDLMKETLRIIEDRYRVKATLYTEEDRAEEVRNFGVQAVQGEGMVEGPLPVIPDAEDPIEKNRRYGDTANFCPVTFAESWVLWKGKEDFAVKFEDKVYLFANEENRDNFLVEPRKYLTGNPTESIPPPRMCIIGLPGTKKTELGVAVAHNYGLMFLSYEELVKQALNISSPDHFDRLRHNERIDPVLRDYLNTGSALPEKIYSEVLHKFWFADPTKKLGFILDDFPKRPVDVQFMIKYRLIPDVVICLTSEEVALKASLLGDLTETWKSEAQIRRTAMEEVNKHAVEEWEEKRQQRFNELLNERREKRYLEKRQALLGEGDESSPGDTSDTTELNAVSQVSFDSVADQRDMDEINGILDLELPELHLEKLPEVNEEVLLQFEAEISELLAVENEAVRKVAELCKPEMIEVVPVEFDFEYSFRNYRKVLFIVDKVKYRSPALFERCYEVSMEVADRLLSCGYYLLSKFGKTCPVQYAEDKIPFQMFLPMEQRYNVFPVIHRSNVYFLIGREAVEKFRANPLKYIMVDRIRFPLIPFNVAVSGPPKCGKTILANRIRNTYGMKLISKGQAIRYVQSYMPFSIVFDGFPNTITEVRHLSYVGLLPNLVVDLQATEDEVFECLSNDVGRRGFRRYSQHFVQHLLEEWTKTAEDFRDWFDREYQVTTCVPINTSNWSVWTQAKAVIQAAFFERKHYFSHVKDDWPLRLANMLVTPLEFHQRQSNYKTFCPCCLHFSNELTSGGDPPDRTGLVQYRKFYYWLCEDHIEQFLKTPDEFLPPYGHNALPQNLPTVLTLKSIPENVFENGSCVVCYKLTRSIVEGSIELSVGYNNRVYLFEDKEHLKLFMKNPQNFMFDIGFKQPTQYASLEYQDLPVLGMLEQYVAKPITKALNYVARRRPIIPGLSVSASAVIGIGLYLKIYSETLPEEYKTEYFMTGDSLYHERRNKLLIYLDAMKSVLNPYLHYEEPLPAFKMLESEVSTTSRVPVPDERFDYLCEYFKPLSKVPAFLNVVDIAGLVKGASEGQGLGNAFLSHISACDAIFHLCRAFEDDDVTHVEGEVNPVRDLDIISEELRLKDEDTLNKNLEKLEKTVGRGGDKKLKPEYVSSC